MRGDNPVMKSEIDGDGLSLRVVDGKPFFTIQGEGPYSGSPAVFLRLHGCPLRCFFCDTEFSNPHDPRLDLAVIMKMIFEIAPSHCRLLVVTGGEPVRQNLGPLVAQMTAVGWIVQVETSGVMWQDCLLDTVIVCSPKTPMIQQKIHDHAHAFKYVIRAGEVSTEDGLPFTNTQVEGGKKEKLARPRRGAPVYLSPMDEGHGLYANVPNLRQVAASSKNFGYIAGLQVHKYLDLP